MIAARLPDGAIEAHIAAAEAAKDRLSEDYFRSACLGRSYWYQGYAMTNIQEFYGLVNGAGTAPASGPVIPAGAIAGVAPLAAPVTPKNWDGDLALATKLPWVAILGTGFAGGNTVLRLREGVERFAITDINNPGASAVAQSGMVVLFDTFGNFRDAAMAAGGIVYNHLPGGCNVLYMDGHAAFIKYPERFPVVPMRKNNYGFHGPSATRPR